MYSYICEPCKGLANLTVACCFLIVPVDIPRGRRQPQCAMIGEREEKKKKQKRRKERLSEKACSVFRSCMLSKRFSSEHFVRTMPAAQTVCCFPLRNALLARFSGCTRRMPQRTCMLGKRVPTRTRRVLYEEECHNTRCIARKERSRHFKSGGSLICSLVC